MAKYLLFIISFAIFSCLSASSQNTKFLDSNISSVQQLLSKYFKGKPVLIDLWASWCTPCIKEFDYNIVLDAYLNQKGIALVYISFDKDIEDGSWRNAISKYNLSENQIRANKSLQDDLTMLIWGGRDAYSIPRYLLFDNNNRLIDNDLPAPSNGKKLYETINEKISSQ